MKPRTMVCGFGINDSTEPSCIKLPNGRYKAIAPYTVWADMIARCYSKKALARWPQNIGSSVAEEWRSLKTFSNWYDDQEAEKGWILTKSIVYPDAKVYSPDTCLMAPKIFSAFFNQGRNRKSCGKIGARKIEVNGRHQVQIKNTIANKSEHLGCFDTNEEAHEAYKNRKREIALELAAIAPNKKIADAIIARYK